MKFWHHIRGHRLHRFVHHIDTSPGLGRSGVWHVTVDDKRILEVPYHLALPDMPPAPRVPLWRRFQYWTVTRARSAADGLAGRLGYVREDECGGDW